MSDPGRTYVQGLTTIQQIEPPSGGQEEGSVSLWLR